VPVYVDRSADLEKAARYIVASKAFDHSTICATEQSVIADRPIAGRLLDLMRQEGAYVTDLHETEALRRALFHSDGSLNTAVVGKSAQFVAAYSGFQIPADRRVLLTPLTEAGRASRFLTRSSPRCWAGMRQKAGTGWRAIHRAHQHWRTGAHPDHLCQR